MKTDRELLELAAKAASIEINAARQCERDAECTEPLGLWTHTQTNWNPITDDGDALRLAVKLMMSVEISEHDESSFAYAGSGLRVYGCENWSGDNGAATRRAITRAAAAIGEGMK